MASRCGLVYDFLDLETIQNAFEWCLVVKTALWAVYKPLFASFHQVEDGSPVFGYGAIGNNLSIITGEVLPLLSRSLREPL